MVQAKSFSLSRSWIKWVHIHLQLLVVISAQSVLGGQIVNYLPGYDGQLPFKLETGYISVDESELFYYFIESQVKPQEDPLFLWLTGGPGCSGSSGLLFEAGPMEFDVSNYTGGLPKLKYYPHAWTKTASMIFLDAPVGTGFSYSRTPEGWPSSDTKSSEQSYNFLMKWLVEHHQFLSVHLFIGGEFHAGRIVPLIAAKIIDGNKDKAEPYVNIKHHLSQRYEFNVLCNGDRGTLVGSPATDVLIDSNSYVEYTNRMALISDEIYENAKRSCKENYVDVDPANSACLEALGDIQKCIKDVNIYDILQPKCDLPSSDLNRRSLEDGASEFLLQPTTVPTSWCTIYNLTHNDIWANYDSVQEALHVRKGTVRQWERCNSSLSYSQDVFSVVAVHKELSRSALKVLVENGDHDLGLPYVGTLKWVKSLNLSLVDDWRPWYIDRQIGGYTMKYSEDEYHLTFATVKGAGHPAPEHSRWKSYHLFNKWVNQQSV